MVAVKELNPPAAPAFGRAPRKAEQGKFEMKTQMRVQKILMLVSLVVSALVFVYALIFMTGGLGKVYYYINSETKVDKIHCTNFVNAAGDFVSTLVALGIVMIVLVAVMYIMACNSRRKYYITNYIAVGVFVVFSLAVAIYMVVAVANVMNLYQNDICWKSGTGEAFTDYKIVDGQIVTITTYGNYADQADPSFALDPNQIYNFVLGFIMFAVVLADAVCVALCTVWKVLLIKGENKLLADGSNGGAAVNTVVAEAAGCPVKEEE